MTDQAEETLKKLTQAALTFGVVLRRTGDRSLVACSDGSLVDTHSFDDALAGQTVLVLNETRQIVKKTMALGLGSTAIVSNVDGKFCTVALDGEQRRIINPLEGLEEGHKVLLDATNSIVMQDLGQDKTFAYESDGSLTWDDVGGHEEVKAVMMSAVEDPVIHAELYKKYKQRRIKGVLLSGPSGCGKSLIAKAAAARIRTANGGKGADTNFIYVKGPSLLNMYVGNSESAIRSLFSRARAHYKKHGYPAILFIDEADALLRSRTGRQSVSGMEATIVPQFLAEMDGLEDSGAMVILATNIPDELDPAVIREGRIDRRIQVGRPKLDEAAAIFKIHLKGRPMKGLSQAMAQQAATELYSAKRVFYTVQMKAGQTVNVCFGDLASGALIAAIVDKATELAIKRDVAEKRSASGITPADLTEAINYMDAQNRAKNHEQDLTDLFGPLETHVEEIRKVKGDTSVPISTSAPQAEAAAQDPGAPGPQVVAVLIPKAGGAPN